MPKGKDFLDEFVAMMVVDADAEVDKSLEALPAGLLRPCRKKRCIAPNVHSDVHCVLEMPRYSCSDMALDSNRQLESGTLQLCVVRCRFSPILFALKSGG